MKLALALKCTPTPLGLLKVLIAVVVIVSLIGNSLIIANASNSNDNADQEEHENPKFYFFMRPRLGHFQKTGDYLKIYEDYFKNVIQVNDKALENLDKNDWRFVRPTGEMCLKFLKGFQVKQYRLNKPYEIIPLDACLNWLFDYKPDRKEPSDEKELDLKRFSARARKDAEDLLKDKKFKQIYDSTLFKSGEIPQELKDNLRAYFKRLLEINARTPKFGCHGLWLETYNDFIEDIYLGDCETEEDCLYFSGLKDSEKDSYLEMIVDSTKQASKNCYRVLQKQMNGLMEKSYQDETVSKLLTRKLKNNRLAAQSDAMKWSEDMVRIMQLVSGSQAEQPIDLSEVAKDLRKLKEGDEVTVRKFTNTLASYAIQNFNSKDSENDHDGQERFGKAMKRLCHFYWEDVDGEKEPFEFYTTIYSLVRLTNHEAIFDITKSQFEEDVLKFKWESLYFTTFACQIISTTWGELDYDSNEEAFQVSLSAAKKFMYEDWPIEILSAKLTKPTSAAAANGESSDSLNDPPQRPSSPLNLGRKFKFSLGNTGSKDKSHTGSADGKDEEATGATLETPPSPLVSTKRSGRQQTKGMFGFKLFKHKSADSEPPQPEVDAAPKPQALPAAPATVTVTVTVPPASEPPAKPVSPSEPAPSSSAPLQAERARPAPEMKPTAPISTRPISLEHKLPTKQLWEETAEIYKQLHGHYPKELPAHLREEYKSQPNAPVSKDRDYSSSFKRSEYQRSQYNQAKSKPNINIRARTQAPAVPLMFDFSQTFVHGKSKFASAEKQTREQPKSAAVNRWSDFNASLF